MRHLASCHHVLQHLYPFSHENHCFQCTWGAALRNSVVHLLLSLRDVVPEEQLRRLQMWLVKCQPCAWLDVGGFWCASSFLSPPVTVIGAELALCNGYGKTYLIFTTSVGYQAFWAMVSSAQGTRVSLKRQCHVLVIILEVIYWMRSWPSPSP